jgi:hypothetical protein
MDITWLLIALFHAMASGKTREEYERAVDTLLQFAGHPQTMPAEAAILRQLAETAESNLIGEGFARSKSKPNLRLVN